MSFEMAELLRRRAESFLRNAYDLMESGVWDLAMFNLEQYCQLILKYLLLTLKGNYPPTHSLRKLIREISEFDKDALKLIEDMRNLHYIARLEEAYISSRYLPYTYEENEVRDIGRFVKEVFRPVIEEIRRKAT